MEQPRGQAKFVTLFLMLHDRFHSVLQEVYDWAGANESFPPYFTLLRGSALVSHEETIKRNETLDVTERVSGQ